MKKITTIGVALSILMLSPISSLAETSPDETKVRKCAECCAWSIAGIEKIDWTKPLPPVEEQCFGACATAFRSKK